MSKKINWMWLRNASQIRNEGCKFNKISWYFLKGSFIRKRNYYNLIELKFDVTAIIFAILKMIGFYILKF